MSGVRLFMVLVLLPALAALGHDLYLFYTNEGVDNVVSDATKIFDEKGASSFFAALGFIWTKYDVESFKAIAQSMDEQTWSYVNKVLAQKAVVVGLAFAGFWYVLLGLLRILGAWPFRDKEAGSKKKMKRMKKARMKRS